MTTFFFPSCKADYPVASEQLRAILEESSAAGDIRFVWDHIDQDADFPFPDYGGETITIQDCWIAVEKRPPLTRCRSARGSS